MTFPERRFTKNPQTLSLVLAITSLRREGARARITAGQMALGFALVALLLWAWPGAGAAGRGGQWSLRGATVAPALPTQAQANGPACSSFTNRAGGNGLGFSMVNVYAVGTTVYAGTYSGLSISANGGMNFTNKTTANGLGSNQLNAVYVAGTTVYAATKGGLSISTNGGDSFTNKTISSGLGNNNVFGVYAAGTTVYAATAGGLSVSTNGGASFTNRTIANGLSSNIVYDVYVVGSIVYAATYGGLAISSNGGASFINKTTIHGLGSDWVSGVRAVGASVYAATGGGLSISTNGGASFTNKTTANGLGNNQVNGVYAAGTTVYAATAGGLAISTDSGASFTNYTTASGLGNNIVRGVYATATSIYAATDGGLSFCPPLGPEINVKGNSMTIANGDPIPAAADGTDFGNVVANTNVVAQSFTIENTGTGELHLTGTPKVVLAGPNAADFSIAMQPNSPVTGSTTFLVNFAPTVTGVRTAGVRIANNDANENPYFFAIQGTGTLPGAACSNFGNKTTISGLGHNQVYDVYAVDRTVYAATSGGLSISYNGGANFTTRATGNGLGSNIVRATYVAGTTVYAATAGGLSISSHNDVSFSNRTISSGLGHNQVYDVYVVDRTVYAATLGGLSISTDGGASFTNRTTANGLGHNAVSDVSVVGVTVYAATYGGLSISTNGGASFTNKTTANGLGNNIVYGVYADRTTIYAATNSGLSISTNGGASFTNRTTANGLGNNIVYGVYAVGATVYAATSGGLSISTDGGASFANYTTASGLGGNSVQGVHATATSIYAATSGGLSLCPPLLADINVKGNSLDIASGDLTPGAADGTDFGNAAANTNVVVRSFSIESAGAGELHLTGAPKVALSGPNAADFSVATQPNSPVAGSTSFVVNFAPTATGARTATVSIANNDADENPYIFAIRGTGTPTPNGPVCSSFTNKGTGSGLGDNNVESVHTVGSAVYAATAGGLAISTNSGASFTNRTTANGLGSNAVRDVYAVGTTVYAATANGLAISTNGGASFANKTTANGLGNNAVRGVYAAGAMVYAATEGGLAISTDGGASFTNRTTANGLGNNFVFSVYAAGATVYAAINGGGLAISTNGGASFTNRTTANGLGSNIVRDIYVAGTTVYAATAGGLSISTDGGANFTNRTNISGLSSVFGVHAAGTTVYAATFLGLMISTNGGVSFTRYTTASGLGNNFVRGVHVTATSIYAATAGGLSFCPPPAPEINVRGNNVTIASGDIAPSLTDHTDFGSTTPNGGAVTRTFVIENTGAVALNLPATYLNNGDLGEFSITTRTPSVVPSSGSTTLTITYRPRSSGTHTVRVYIENNDLNENPYIFAIQGMGLAAGINVAGNTTATLTATDDEATLSQAGQNFAANGGADSFTVQIDAACSWTATSNDPSFITVTSPTGLMTGPGMVNFTVASHANTTPRSGSITVAGQTFAVQQGAQFLDVPIGAPFYEEIGKLSAAGVTKGCGGGNYCPDSAVSREQMAAFLSRALGVFNPPTLTTQRFADVLPPGNALYAFIEEVAARQITLGCGNGNYCPNDFVSRQQMAAFITRALHEPGYQPPTDAPQRFADVPPSNPFYAHIEEMAVRGIALGCGDGNYCPMAYVTRQEMAAFLVRAFGL